ncbi:hypothetical protein YTPLAS18_15440 [Nitrospira sp.]|nr:hypothetical protein YTPLAS18_15440 [Nitrospira sp.]
MERDQPAEPLRVLVLEDSETDTELIIRELRKHGFAPTWVRVDTEEDFLRHIHEPFDLLTADANMPQFSALRAVSLLHEHQLDIPCLVVSGSIGEEEAVALIRAGASDYLMKDRLGRLGQAIRHVLDQRKLREEHRQAHKALVALNEELERRIAERTAELERLNQDLARELVERRQIEMLLRQHEATLEDHVKQRTAQLERSQQNLRRLAFQLTLTEQVERKRLAGDLHDYLAQLLVVAKLKLGQLRNAPLDSGCGSVIHELDSHVDQALTYTRTLVAQLSPTVLFRHGLIAALKSLADLMHPHGLTVSVLCHVASVSLPEDQAVLLFQSVRELLFNVVKHAHTSSASIDVTVSKDQILTIVVRDQGIGFDGELATEGSGSFGLFTIRERIEVMGGTFSLRSSRGAGTAVELSLPLSQKTDRAKSAVEPTLTPPTLPVSGRPPQWRAMVVDDHALVRRELIEVLAHMGSIEIVGEASNGLQAVELASTLRPDLILMDVNMPAMDGLEATRRILAARPATRIIGVTIQSDPTVLSGLLSAGAVDSVSKDVLHSHLEPAIRRALAIQ